MREQLQARNRPAGGEEVASLSAASAAAAAAAGWTPPLPRPAMGMPIAAAPGLALSAPGSVHAHPSMVMHAAAMPDPSQAALGLPAAVMSSMAHAHPAVAPRAPDAHERAIIERILAEKAVQLEATHDHLVANLAMYQPPQPPPPHSSQYFCQR